MNSTKTKLKEVLLLEPTVFNDSRGFFLESYNENTLKNVGINTHFVQDNHSRSKGNVLRGLHYQLGKPQAKLVRVIQGEVFDVAIDIRRGSPTFGEWVSECLSAENKRQMYIPEGFAHGFLVLSDYAEFEYKCSDYYTPEEQRGIIWNDPKIAINWPINDGRKLILSEKDAVLPKLDEMVLEDLPVYPGS